MAATTTAKITAATITKARVAIASDTEPDQRYRAVARDSVTPGLSL
jgi:hypothetical protein